MCWPCRNVSVSLGQGVADRVGEATPSRMGIPPSPEMPLKQNGATLSTAGSGAGPGTRRGGCKMGSMPSLYGEFAFGDIEPKREPGQVSVKQVRTEE